LGAGDDKSSSTKKEGPVAKRRAILPAVSPLARLVSYPGTRQHDLIRLVRAAYSVDNKRAGPSDVRSRALSRYCPAGISDVEASGVDISITIVYLILPWQLLPRCIS